MISLVFRPPIDSLTSDLVSDMIGCMAREMDDLCIHLPNLENFIVFEKVVKHFFVLFARNLIFRSKKLLNLLDSFSDADRWLEALMLMETALQIRSCCQMISVRVCLQNLLDVKPALRNDF